MQEIKYTDHLFYGILKIRFALVGKEIRMRTILKNFIYFQPPLS